MVLLRHLLGDALRRLRLRQGRTLREVSAAARVSLGYLSEVERGQKEASSELLAAICTGLNPPCPTCSVRSRTASLCPSWRPPRRLPRPVPRSRAIPCRPPARSTGRSASCTCPCPGR